MTNMNENIMSEEALTAVAGGAKSVNLSEDSKKKLFEAAWTGLKMDDMKISGMKKAEMFDEWEMAGFTPDAVTFLSGVNKTLAT